MRPYPLSSGELIDDVVSELDRVRDTVQERFGALDDEQLAWQATPKTWGIGHCLVHLARTNELYRETLASAFRSASPGDGAGPLKGRPMGRLFTWLVGPGVPVKVKSPDIVKPRQRTVSAGALEAFLVEQHRLRGLAGDASGLDLDGIVVRSPLGSWLKLTAGDALRVVVAHEARHLSQAEAVLAEVGFPQ